MVGHKVLGWGVCCAGALLLCVGAGGGELRAAQAGASGGENAGVLPLTGPELKLARDIYQQLIETDTTRLSGSTKPAAEAMKERLLAAGFPAGDIEMVGPSDRFMNLVVRYRGVAGSTKKPVLVIGHLDVVEAQRRDWTVEPFKLTEDPTYFYGRGTQDMKDSDAAYVASFILLRKAGYLPSRDMVLALTADEEGGGENGVLWLLHNVPSLVRSEYAVNPDTGSLLLREGRPVELDMALSEKTYADFEIVGTSAGGHSSRPVPDNAIYEVAAALGRVERSPFPIELNAASRAYLEAEAHHESQEKKMLIARVIGPKDDMAAAQQLSADPGYNSVLRTTCVVTMMQGGEAKNALPAAAGANVNCRILPGHSVEEVRRQLVTMVDDLKLKVLWKSDDGVLHEHASTEVTTLPAAPLPGVMRTVRAVTAAMWPGIPVVPEMSPGSSDSVYTMADGIPTYGISGMGIDENDDRAHGKDERLRVKAFYEGVAFTRELVKELGEE